MTAHALISERALLGRYYQRLEQGAHPWLGDLTMEIESTQDSENHVWLGMPPQLREWVGGKHAKQFRDFSYEIRNKDFESTIEYHERDLAEDKTGQLQVRIDEHAARALSHPAKLVSDLIIAGESTTCYDGQYFFDTDHSEGDSGSQSNDLTYDVTTTTAPTASEMEAAILQSIGAMFGFKDDQGEPLNEGANSFLVMVPWQFFAAAQKAALLEVIVDGSASRTNLIAKMKNSDGFNITVKSNPRLTWTTKFATFRTDGNVKPFIDQVREKVSVKVLGDGSDFYFETRRKRVSIEKAGNVGYGLWQGAVLTTLV